MQSNQAASAKNAPVVSEVFSEQKYLESAQLVPRGQNGAMVHNVRHAADNLIGVFNTVREIRARLTAHSVQVASWTDT